MSVKPCNPYVPEERPCYNHKVQGPKSLNTASTIAIALGIIGALVFCTALILMNQHVSVLHTLTQHAWLILGVAAVPILGAIGKIVARVISKNRFREQLKNIKIDWSKISFGQVAYSIKNNQNFMVHDRQGARHQFHFS